MIIEKLEIKKYQSSLNGELKFMDAEISQEDCEKMINRLVSWKLGPLTPTRHFEMVYNTEKKEAELDVYVSVPFPKSSENPIHTVKHVSNKLTGFLDLYEKCFEDIYGIKR
ncbi:MAG: hypothetical protein PHY59_09505 [Methanobacterium sp.]|nr:hypothetical protein [Methanobacterium sp.]